jgi:hypothetical protein
MHRLALHAVKDKTRCPSRLAMLGDLGGYWRYSRDTPCQ